LYAPQLRRPRLVEREREKEMEREREKERERERKSETGTLLPEALA